MSAEGFNYSEDMQHGQQFDAASIVNPFLDPVQGG